MHVINVRGWDEDVVIKRLSKNEKAILLVLRLYQKVGPDMMIRPPREHYSRFFGEREREQYVNGDLVDIPRLMRDTGIKHRSSLSRTLKRLEEKQLIYSHGNCMTFKRKDDAMFGTGDYTKYVTLTAAGEMMADLLERERDNILQHNDNRPSGEIRTTDPATLR